MGKLIYGQLISAEFEDRLLAHLEIVITAKLRRGEGFLFSWKEESGATAGRTTIWVHPSLPLVYKYSGSRTPSINRAWIEVLSQSASSAGGLRVLAEPAERHHDEFLH
ncbi:hypothetical protein ACFFGH_23700 [Lysobacter korlensis]|uniref:DUF7882 domain-containing protein n=1 Tax=Lysobacter korlensis TaxID=553636 RepID=A0ABV6RWM6_9GAMM